MVGKKTSEKQMKIKKKEKEDEREESANTEKLS